MYPGLQGLVKTSLLVKQFYFKIYMFESKNLI